MKFKQLFSRWKRWLLPLLLTAAIALILNPELRAFTLVANALGYDALLVLASAALRTHGSQARFLLIFVLALLPLCASAFIWMLEAILPRWTFGIRLALLLQFVSPLARGGAYTTQIIEK